jgi:probable HAF family extracellular repeat protein
MRTPRIVSAAAFLLAVPSVLGQTITPVGAGPIGPTFFAGSVSADGSTFIGQKSDTPGGTPYPARWTTTLGVQDMRPLLGGISPRVEGVDGTGSVLIGFDLFSGNFHATRWTAAGGNEDLGPGPGASATASSASRVSADSRVIFGGWVGTNQTKGLLRWTREQGMQDIGPVFGASQYSIEGVSGDGGAIAGYAVVNASYVGFKWTQSVSFVALAPLSIGMPSAALGISQDAVFTVGYSYLNHNRATRWGSDGIPQNLGVLSGGIDSYAYATSADDSVVVGVSDAALLGDRAFLWTSSLGMVDLNTYLPTLGMDLSRWTLINCRGISADGRTIVGNGAFDHQQVGFIITGLPSIVTGVCCRGSTCVSGVLAVACVPPGGMAGAQFGAASACNASPTATTPCCHADYNKTSGVTVQDIFDYLSDWFSASPFAKVGGTGGPAALQVQDIFDYLSDWFAGC